MTKEAFLTYLMLKGFPLNPRSFGGTDTIYEYSRLGYFIIYSKGDPMIFMSSINQPVYSYEGAIETLKEEGVI